MNQQTPITPKWPIQIESGATGSLVVLIDGVSVDLDRFRDDCRRHAAELRQQAMDDAFRSVLAAAGKAWLSTVCFLRSAFARNSAADAHRA